MTVSSALFVILVAFAVSYGWGMRGTIIGGEKGALLPGALLGMFIALLSGIDIISANFWIFLAAGALGTAFGGFEPYAQTMDMVLYRDRETSNLKKGYAALSLKGALWFGIGGAVLGLAFSAASGKVYQGYEIVIVLALEPLIQLLGVKLFNKPFDKANGIFPKLYFCRTSREEWGGNLLFLLSLVILMAVKSDTYALAITGFGMLSGAVGWCLGIFLYDRTNRPLKNGKYIFGGLQSNGKIDGWKIMEFTLGAVGGGGIALGFCLNYGKLSQMYEQVETLWNPLSKVGDLLAWVSLVLIIAMPVMYAMIAVINKKSGGNEIDSHIPELIERPFLFVLPMILVLLGSLKTAQMVAVFELYWVLAEKCAFERFAKFKTVNLWRALLLLGAAVIVAYFASGGKGIDAVALMLIYTVLYLVAEWLWCFSPERLRDIKLNGKTTLEILKGVGSAVTVYAYFIFQTAVLLIICIKCFT